MILDLGAEVALRSFYGATYLLAAIGEHKQILSIAYYLIFEDSILLSGNAIFLYTSMP
jgi:hypothetical protein